MEHGDQRHWFPLVLPSLHFPTYKLRASAILVRKVKGKSKNKKETKRINKINRWRIKDMNYSSCDKLANHETAIGLTSQHVE